VKASRKRTKQLNLHQDIIKLPGKKQRKGKITIAPSKPKTHPRSKDIRAMFTQKDKRNENRKLEAERIPLDKHMWPMASVSQIRPRVGVGFSSGST
jgi:hypothetical protein